MVRKAQNPSPAPTQNPWNRGGAGPVKTTAASQSGTSTPKDKGPAVEKAVEQPQTPQQGGNGFNADEVRKMFEEDAKAALEGLGGEAVLKLPDEGKKQAWGTQRKPGTMSNGQSFAAELGRQLAELEQNKTSS
ncbi:uncharacterized protein PV09_06088 [Verruconis gallopava]|uniref:Uncharacterized protein n=1 Tax=Verruconis gallopava TaxID=253628 RepID=A0A0D2A7V4_9PEZI|nr:uncharacterized protein PV09_06088 [Verruconis gallopava]KIW02650.1 hypothetical protein PV09_06088 [Verruconis gallopava]